MKRSLVRTGGIALVVILAGSAGVNAADPIGNVVIPSFHGTPLVGRGNLPPVLTGLSPFISSIPQSPLLDQVPWYARYPGYYNNMPYYPSYPWAYPRPAANNQPNNTKGWRLEDGVKPPPGTDNKPADAPPPDAQVRLHFLPFTVTGVKDTADSDRLTRALEKMKGVKGASVKRRGEQEVYVKVWFSDKETVEADDVVKTCTQLGFAGALADD